MRVASLPVLSTHLHPLCSRDDHSMSYESNDSSANIGFQPSYHCRASGCTVRYNEIDGYFTLVGLPDHTYPIDEPGINTLKCPYHDRWLYRGEFESTGAKPRIRWACGVQGCNYVHEARPS
jgi:hypothetical protein